MIIKQELIRQIKDHFNLNIYETKVWLALLTKGIASAGEIAEISRVPRSRAYDVLESLEKQGFAIMKLGKPIKYIAVKPHVILEKLKSNVEKSSEEKMESLDKLKETNEYAELEQLYNIGIEPIKQEEISGAIKGKSTFYTHLKELLGNAKKEVIICTTTYEIQSKSRFFALAFERLKKAKVDLKIALSGDEKEIKKINSKFKINAKLIDIDTKFFIVDKDQVLFSINKPESTDEEIGIWLNTTFFASSLAFMFEQAIRY